MSSIINNIHKSKIINNILKPILFILLIPYISIIVKSIFALGILLGTYTRTLGI